MPYLGIFGLESKKTIVPFEISTLEFFLIAKFSEKTKMSNFGTKNALLGYFWVTISKNYCYI